MMCKSRETKTWQQGEGAVRCRRWEGFLSGFFLKGEIPPQAQKSSPGSVILSCQLEDKVPSHRGAPKLGQHTVPTAGKQHFTVCFAALSGACASLAVCSAVVPL